ncbi:uncharacterized protein LOC118193710 isoform X2 [Stegodyphus dumicola]|uniref:uncharacterized protein LOC118193710 isoform X2 n=1 Tax=Stegodyphus dumicola TaxID=202533 RepID=UPI0015AE275E|nr:uncharacterized protein LOC118193710 isoform X2 [Stegodyphus dumicola]
MRNVSNYGTSSSYLFRWGRLTRADWLEEQDRRNLRSRIQNPDSPRETEGLFPSNTEGRDQDPDTSSQSEGSGTSSPQIGVQNPGSSHQTRGSFISRYQNPGSSFETAGTLV